MKTLLILITSLCFAINSFAQINETFFSEVQTLVEKANGKKIVDLMGNDTKIDHQIFSQDLVSFTHIGLGKHGSEWVFDYTGMDFKKINYYLWQENSNDNLYRLVIEFGNNVLVHQHVKGEVSDKRATSSMEMHFLAKDYDKMDQIFKQYFR